MFDTPKNTLIAVNVIIVIIIKIFILFIIFIIIIIATPPLLFEHGWAF